MITIKHGTVETLITDALHEVDTLVTVQQQVREGDKRRVVVRRVVTQIPLRPQTAGIEVIYGITDKPSISKHKARSTMLRDAIEMLETAERVVKYHTYRDDKLLEWLGAVIASFKAVWQTLFQIPYVSRTAGSAAAGEAQSPRPPTSSQSPDGPASR